MLRELISLLAVLIIATTVFAQDEKPSEKRSIIVETDSGRYGVGAEKLDPKKLGLAIYPGAKLDESENNKSDASLSFDWGQESTRLYVQKYVSSDSPDKVLTFYRKQLAKYGPVLECRNGKPIGPVPAGAKCDSDKQDSDIELKAGTDRKQHIVGVKQVTQGTEFGLVYLEQTVRNKR